MTLDMDSGELQTSIIVSFVVTLSTSLVPPIVKHIRSLRRDNNVFKVSDTNGAKTCLEHHRQCSSAHSILMNVINFFVGGLLFGLLVMRIMPTTYAQFGAVYKTNTTIPVATEPSVVTEDNVIILSDNTNNINHQSEPTPKKSLPYVEMMIAGFFFIVYFVDQVLQVII